MQDNNGIIVAICKNWKFNSWYGSGSSVWL